MNMSADEIAIRQRLKDELPHYAAKCLKIRGKGGEIMPLVLNRAQLHLHGQIEQQLADTGRVRIIGLKGRQQGFSTYVEARAYWKVTHRKGYRAFILTHEDEATKNMFEIANRFHEHCPPLVRPRTGAANANELNFDLLDSGYKIGTARTKGTGRSSTVQFFHGSEVAHWPNAADHAAGVLQAVPDLPGTEVFYESTANGIGNFFHQEWRKAETGESDFLPVFIPWFWQDEYRRAPGPEFRLTAEEQAHADFFRLTLDQMAWRRAKLVEIGETLFKQEYPSTAAEAFQTTGLESLIKAEFILAARKRFVEPHGPLIVGVDPAGEGKDRTSIAWRRTRRVTRVKSERKLKPMQIVGKCAEILRRDKPAAMFIDLGERGHGIVDRLHELGWANVVHGVNFGEKANNGDLYIRRRDEMWCSMRDWYEEGGCQVPDSDPLHADTASVSGQTDSNNRMVLMTKREMKKLGLPSPDEGDAVALTFAAPVSVEGGRSIPQQEPDYFGTAA